MLVTHSISTLYTLALAEGEGVGTAYEYFAKRLVLGRWLGAWRPRHILVAGLPEKYGASLDFLLLAADLGAAVTVVDDRQSALARANQARQRVTAAHMLKLGEPEYRFVSELSNFTSGVERWDLLLSSEVVQRLAAGERQRYGRAAAMAAERVALFMPNGDNPAHTGLSGLDGLSLAALGGLVGDLRRADGTMWHWQSGYVDAPPFPPGMVRTESQRQQATTGAAERLAMWGLGYYARLERFFPSALPRRHAHIVYALGE
jgi:hypothetical protein